MEPPPTLVLLLPPAEQQLRDVVLDEVQQLDGVGHPQEQRLQTWDQLLHAEHLQPSWLPVPRRPGRKGRGIKLLKGLPSMVLALLRFWKVQRSYSSGWVAASSFVFS